MKTKILIPLAGVALFCACKGAGSGSERADTVGVAQKRKKWLNRKSNRKTRRILTCRSHKTGKNGEHAF